MRAQFVDAVEEDLEYPESDGLPMAENTRQLFWILKLLNGLLAWYRNDPNVFVAGDLFWYPVQGNREIRTAPDVMVAFGRPKGHRSSYRQWREGGIAPQVVVEIRSPSNTEAALEALLDFYSLYGVEEYYLYDPAEDLLEGWSRGKRRLVRIRTMNGHISPRLGIRFDASGPELVVYLPDGKPFLSPEVQAEEQKKALQKVNKRAKREKERANLEKHRADQEKKRADGLEAKLRELGIDPNAI
jgi:Uma2 family endonuclease